MTTLIPLLAALVLQAPDTVVVRADGPPEWGDDARLVEEIRIGALDGPDVYLFGRVSGVAMGDDGSVYVADMQVPAIRHFDTSGSWIRDVGREGEGPGEYRYIYGMRRLAGGPLAILDPRNARVTRWVDGEYHSSFPSLSGLHAADIFAVDTAGRSYVKTMILDAPRRTVTLADGSRYIADEPPQAWIRFDADGEVTDTVPIPPDAEEGGGFVLSGKGGYFRPFSVMTVSTLSPHGYLVEARNDAYALHRPLADGRVLRIEGEGERVPLGRRERNEWEGWIEYFQGRAREMGTGASFGPLPDRKPFIRHLFVDDDGRIWVALYAEARYRPYTDEEREERGDRPDFQWRQPLVWEVLHPEGRFLGRVTLPHGTSLMAARGSTVWGAQAGEWDEEYVVRFRIDGSGVVR